MKIKLSEVKELHKSEWNPPIYIMINGEYYDIDFEEDDEEDEDENENSNIH